MICLNCLQIYYSKYTNKKQKVFKDISYIYISPYSKQSFVYYIFGSGKNTIYIFIGGSKPFLKKMNINL